MHGVDGGRWSAHGLIAEAAAPGEHVRNGRIIFDDCGFNGCQVAVLRKYERLANSGAAIGIFVVDASPIG